MESKEYLTIMEVAELLKVNITSIHLLIKRRKLQPYCCNKRIYLKRSEIRFR